MIVLGLDIAGTTGWAIYNSCLPPAEMRTGILRIKGDTPEEKAAHLGHLTQTLLINKTAPAIDLVMIEEPLRVIVAHGSKINPATAAALNALAGAAVAVCAVCGYKWRTVAVAAWRKHFLGYARRKGMASADYKRACMERCRMLGIKIERHDAADAAGIAFYGISVK